MQERTPVWYGNCTVDYVMVGGGGAAARWIFHLSGRSRARSSTFTMFIPTTATPATNLSLY